MNGAKMMSGLLAKSPAGIGFRVAALVAMAWGTWAIVAWATGFVHSKVDGPGFAIVMLGIVQAAAAITALTTSSRSLAEDTALAPLLIWASMTDNGREVPVWAIVLELLLVPAEMVVCILLALAWIAKGTGVVLCCKVRSQG